MNKLINRGLNFTILPFKLDITEVLVDFKRFATHGGNLEIRYF